MSRTPDHERFPFTRQPGETEDAYRERLGQAIEGIDAFIRQQVHRAGASRYVDDITQEVKIFLFHYAAPKYDTQRIPHSRPPSNFLMHCAYHKVIEEARKLGKKHKKLAKIDGFDFERIVGRDMGDDIKADALIERFQSNPAKYLTRKQLDILKLIDERIPGENLRDIAQRAGWYRQTSSLYMAVRRMRDRILQKLEQEAA
jgi:DNA-directed RNA polymerase specialized sigma24 family protein